MFKIFKKILFSRKVDSFIIEAKKVFSDGKIVMSYVKESRKIIFFFAIEEKIIFITKEINSSIKISKINFSDILNQSVDFIKAIEMSQKYGEVIDSSETIYFVFNFLGNIKEQFGITLLEQKTVMDSILKENKFFAQNPNVSIPMEKYSWVD